MEPNVDERERAMGFPTRVTLVPSIYEASCRHVLGQAMDLNCLTWIVSLGMAEQRRLRATFIVATLTWPSVGVKPNTWKELGFGVLRGSRMFRARQKGAKHLALGCSWCHWKGLET